MKLRTATATATAWLTALLLFPGPTSNALYWLSIPPLWDLWDATWYALDTLGVLQARYALLALLG